MYNDSIQSGFILAKRAHLEPFGEKAGEACGVDNSKEQCKRINSLAW